MRRRSFLYVLLVLLVASMIPTHAESPKTPSGLPRVEALYVPMRDGVRIAADVWLPESLERDQKVPALMRATRYWRAQGVTDRNIEKDSNYAEAQLASSHGYALVLVDVRGTGASFGTREHQMTPDEVKDLGEVADWIARQPWSNGNVGAYGVSYDGNTAEMLAVNGRPSVKAIAPLFNDFNWIRHLIMPGGVKLTFFLEEWGKSVAAMDANDICTLAGVEGQACDQIRKAVTGVKPVDADTDGSMLSSAIAEHATNMKVYEAVSTWDYHDDPMGPKAVTDVNERTNPSQHLAELAASGVAYYVPVGWLDAATVNGALGRSSSLTNPQQVTIGPWSHGGNHHIDPFLPPNTTVEPSRPDQRAEMYAFFDRYLKDGATGGLTSSIRYYTLGAGTWSTTQQWPPDGFTPVDWYFGPDGALLRSAPTLNVAADAYQINYDATTGSANRWHTNAGGGDVIYPDRADEDKNLLVYTSAPMDKDVEITGSPVVTLHLRSTHDDGAFFVYLEDVAPNGRVTYITEGQLRGTCREVSMDKPEWAVFGPHRTYTRRDSKSMPPGESMELTFDLWATSVRIKEGHAIRVAIAGADKDNFIRLPAGEAVPVLTVERSATSASKIVLPMK